MTKADLYDNIIKDFVVNDLLDLETYDSETAQEIATEIIEKHLGQYIILQGVIVE